MNFPRQVSVLLCAALLTAGGSAAVQAQALSPEADQAFWCAAAYTNLVKKEAFASAAQQEAALADLSRFESAMAADAARLGWQQADIEALARSFDEEVAAQIADYLLWKDPAALRLNLGDCFPSVSL